VDVKIQHAVIMAAGRGQRMMPLTQDVAKPMAPYLDTTLIGHGISQVKAQVPNVHITVGYKAMAVAQHVLSFGISTVINTEGQPSSWWLYNSLLKHLDEPVFVLTCDNVTDVDFAALEDDYCRMNQPTCMVVPVAPVEGLDGDYVFHDANRYVTKLSRTDKSSCYCSGIQVVNPRGVNMLAHKTSSFYDVWNELIKHKQMRVSSVFPRRWTAVDTVSDLERANNEATGEP
jgi:NDP-sugar pyrophosphorylase family protein